MVRSKGKGQTRFARKLATDGMLKYSTTYDSYLVKKTSGSINKALTSSPLYHSDPFDSFYIKGKKPCSNSFLASSLSVANPGYLPAASPQHIMHAPPLSLCAFFPFILDFKFVVRTSRGHTGGRSHRIFHPPSFCGACLNFSREKGSAFSFPPSTVKSNFVY